MKVEIIAVGTEVLMGDIINTNAQYIARKLSSIGLGTYYHTAVGDNPNRLEEVFKVGFDRADILITTGGLGPTNDDITKEVVAKYFNKKLELNSEVLENIRLYFQKSDRTLPSNNKKQAYFPKDSIIIPNPNGTAPGCVIEEDDKILIMLPGPLREVESMFEDFVMPYLSKFSEGVLISDVIRTFGIGESHMEEMIEDIIKDQDNPTIAPYATDGELIIRLTAWGETKEKARKSMKPVKKQIYNKLGKYIYAEDERQINEIVSDELLKNNITVSVAESCTGGMLSSKLIDYPGISAIFKQGAVTYTNESKVQELKVKEKTLSKYGAVSSQIAIEMANGIRVKSNSDIGISTTGVAGPGGGTKEKPVGLVYIGISTKNNTVSYKLNLRGSRQRIRSLTTTRALYYILKTINERK